MKVIALIAGGLLAAMAVSKWSKCSTTYYTLDAAGQRLPDGAPCNPPGSCRVVAAKITPSPGCLFDPGGIFVI